MTTKQENQLHIYNHHSGKQTFVKQQITDIWMNRALKNAGQMKFLMNNET